MPADLDPGAWADQDVSAEPVWLTHPDSAEARALAVLDAEDARVGGLVPPREPDPGPWDIDDEGIDSSIDACETLGDVLLLTGDLDNGSGDGRRNWPRVCSAEDLASPGHVPLAVGGQSPLALLELIAADAASLHPGELIDALTAAEQLKAWVDAQQLSALSTLSDWCGTLRGVGPGRDQVPVEAMAGAEAGPALGVTPRTAALRVGLARDLRRLPATREALRSGRITLAKARAVSEALLPLEDADAAEVESRVLARHSGATLPNLTAALRRAVIAVDPAAAEERHRRAVKARGVWREALEDGLSRLEWIAPADQVEAAHAALTAAARAAQAADRLAARTARDNHQPEPDVRTLDEVRSDVLADLTGDRLGDLLRGQRRSGRLQDDHCSDGTASPAGRQAPGEAGGAFGGPTATGAPPAGEAAGASAGGDPTDHAAADGVPVVDTAGSDRGDGAAGEPAATTESATPQASHDDAGHALDCLLPRPRGQIGVVVGLATLLGLDDLPAELPGYGPIPASMARRLAADGTWRRILTDGVGRVLDYSTRAHDPPPDLAAFIQARDRTCRFPGCRMLAIRCDLDHNLPHPDGDTEAGNLCCLCRTHHRIKTLTDTWLTNDGHGRMTWTMPSGKTWTTDPPPALDDPPLDGPLTNRCPDGAAGSESAEGGSARKDGTDARVEDGTAPAEGLTGDPMIDDPPPF